MMVVDTNIVSLMMRRHPDAVACARLNSRLRESMWITSITAFEVRFGIETLAHGRRRIELAESFARSVDENFQGRILEFDTPAAYTITGHCAGRRQHGRPVEMRDTFPAGIMVSRRAELAIRNIKHFCDLEISVLDPWS
jgi:toxin FitB